MKGCEVVRYMSAQQKEISACRSACTAKGCEKSKQGLWERPYDLQCHHGLYQWNTGRPNKWNPSRVGRI